MSEWAMGIIHQKVEWIYVHLGFWKFSIINLLLTWFISSEIINGLIQLFILYKKPIGNAILTCISEAQAKKRGDKGYEAALAVLEVLNAK